MEILGSYGEELEPQEMRLAGAQSLGGGVLGFPFKKT